MTTLELWAEVLDWIVRVVNIVAFVLASFAYFRWYVRRRTVQKFFGGKSLITCFPARNLSHRTVVDEADLVAAQKLARFLGKYGIEVHHELIQPDGNIDLDRDGLVVICGPKTSTIIRRVMERDDVIRFEHDEAYWYLADQSKTKNYYSLRDTEGLNADIGYISRTERSAASSKKFLSIAGIHAQGSTIVVDHLCNYRVIKSLVKRYRNGSFSAVIGGSYEPSPMTILDTREILSRQRTEWSNSTEMYVDAAPRPEPND